MREMGCALMRMGTCTRARGQRTFHTGSGSAASLTAACTAGRSCAGACTDAVCCSTSMRPSHSTASGATASDTTRPIPLFLAPSTLGAMARDAFEALSHSRDHTGHSQAHSLDTSMYPLSAPRGLTPPGGAAPRDLNASYASFASVQPPASQYAASARAAVPPDYPLVLQASAPLAFVLPPFFVRELIFAPVLPFPAWAKPLVWRHMTPQMDPPPPTDLEAVCNLPRWLTPPGILHGPAILIRGCFCRQAKPYHSHHQRSI